MTMLILRRPGGAAQSVRGAREDSSSAGSGAVAT